VNLSMSNQIGYSGVVARFVGKAFVAFGFILGTYGLTEKQDAVMHAGLGLLVAGVVASAYGLFHWVRYRGVTAHGNRGERQ